MKKYTLLGHVFELEENAYHFLGRYIDRIEQYASTHNISQDVVDDIKYSMIEKLYRYEMPITEKQVLEIANTLGEPEVMFDDGDESVSYEAKASLRKRALLIDKEKPMIRGVCFRLAKSMNISVRVMRIIFIILALLNGTGLILYVILALFVPFKDKKKTTGVIGNVLFEIVRVVFWLFILSGIVPITIVSIVVTGLIFFTPVIDNQSIVTWIPQYMYVVGVLMSIAFLLLTAGAIGSLFKQRWINKALVLIATIIILGGAVVTIGTGYKTVMLATTHQTTVEENLSLPSSKFSGDRVTIDLTKVNKNSDYRDVELGNADITLIRTTGNDMQIKVQTTIKGWSDEELHDTASKLVPLLITGDKNNIVVSRQSNAKLFSQEVPFGMLQRHIIISVPADKEVYINKDHRVNMSVQNDAYSYRVSYCEANVYVYNEQEKSYTCKQDVWDDPAYDNKDMEGIQEDNVTGDVYPTPQTPSRSQIYPQD